MPQVHPDDRPALTQAIHRTLSEGIPYECQYRVKMMDGVYRWISARGDVVERKNGKPIRAVGVSQDITERKQADEALRASEERFRIIAASTPDHLLVQDRNLRYTLVMNPQLGLTEQDMIGKTDHDFLLKAEADSSGVLNGKFSDLAKNCTWRCPPTSRTGELMYFEGDFVPKRNLQGAVDGLIGYFRNVTARKQAEENIAARVAESKANVLITGENGTGKEVLAKAIHYISPRKDAAFVAVNVPALTELYSKVNCSGTRKVLSRVQIK